MSDEFCFDFSWNGPEKGDSEIAATLALLRLSVGENSLTRVSAGFERTVRDDISVSLYPLAEWFVSSWFSLQNEISGPLARSRSVAERHDLRWAGDGFAWPALTIFPVGPFAHLSWHSYSHKSSDLEFLTSGDMYLESSRIWEAVSYFVNRVVSRLEVFGISGTPLQQDWDAIQNLDEDERKFCAKLGSLGLDPFDLEKDESKYLLDMLEEVTNEFSEDIFPFLKDQELGSRIELFRHARREVVDHGMQLQDIEALRVIIAEVSEARHLSRPWELGYEAARRFRRARGIPNERVPAGEIFGLHERATCRVELPPIKGLDGLVMIGEKDARAGFVRPLAPPRNHFRLCRAAFQAASNHAGVLAAVADTQSYTQKAGRAFAAEFLAPAETIRDKLAADCASYASDDVIESLASDLGVSDFVVRHQIENRRLATLAGS